MSFAPLCPTTYVPPTKVAADTFVIHQVQEALGQPLFVYLNSMVILGAEPMIVDTGTLANREQWLKDVFSLVEPEDVRWIFLSHDDVDHTGNLEQVMEACPNATLVCNWAMVERHTNCFDFPLDRCRWVMDGESLDIGDRTLLALRPPVYDSPTTRGLFDPTTGVYWSVGHLRHAAARPGAGIADLDKEFWDFGMTLFALGAVSPWLSLVDPVKYGALRRPGAEPRHHDGRRVPHTGDRGPVHRAGVRPSPPAPGRSIRRPCRTSRCSTRSSRRPPSPRRRGRSSHRPTVRPPAGGRPGGARSPCYGAPRPSRRATGRRCPGARLPRSAGSPARQNDPRGASSPGGGRTAAGDPGR